MNTDGAGPDGPSWLSDSLGPLPPADPRRALQYDAIRYVPGYPESYLQEYARAYAAEQVAAERERCVETCRRLRSLDGDFLARAIQDASKVNWPKRA